jgi:hypothetical protein
MDATRLTDRIVRTLGTAWLTAWLLGLPVLAQDPPAPTPAPAQIAKLDQWPAGKERDKERLLALVGQFRKDPALHEKAIADLIAIGDTAMPLLLQQISDRPENVNAPLFRVFDRVLGPQHAALLAVEAKKPRVELRRYLLVRLCRFVDPDLAPVLKTHVADADAATSFHASLGLLALKHESALPAVLQYSKTHWPEVGAVVAEVLPRARGAETGTWVFASIAKSAAADQMAGLRLARYLAVKDQAVILRTYLQSPDHTVKKEAVNAMRVLHGEPPIESLDVFKAIAMAKEWLAKS